MASCCNISYALYVSVITMHAGDYFPSFCRAFCNPADVEAFTEEKKESLLVKRHGKGSDFVRAVHEIIECYEKLKKEDQVNNGSCTDEQSLISESNNTESLNRSFPKDDAPATASQSCRRKMLRSSAENVNVKPDDATVVAEDLQDIDMLSKEVTSGSMAQTGLINTYLTRGRLECSQAQKGVLQRQPPSRRTRSSSRVDTNKVQNLGTTSNSYAVRDAANVLREGSGRKNKRIRKSPDADRQDVDSPDLASNCSIEGNDSEILTADSDNLSLNEGSTVESDCKTVQPESVHELCHGDAELSQRLDFQANAVIHKKKRKPSRKRSTNDATELTVKSEEKIASDTDVVKTEHTDVVKAEHVMPSDHERATERYSKDDGDEHLPLVKRARVRMGRALSTGEELETSPGIEEKLQEGSNGISELVRGSSNKEGDVSMDQSSSLAKKHTHNSSPQNRYSAIKPQLWEARKNQQFCGSLDGEAALPPSKRLHRALEAMSANAAENDRAPSDEASNVQVDTIGSCPSAGFSKLSVERKLSSESLAGKVQEGNDASKDCIFSDSCVFSEIPIVEGRMSSAEVAVSSSGESPKRGSCKHTVELDNSDGKHHLGSSNVVFDTVLEVESTNLLPPNNCVQDASVNCDNGSQGLAIPLVDGNAGRSELDKPCTKPDPEITSLSSNDIPCNNSNIHSPNNATSMPIDRADDRGNEIAKSCQLSQVGNGDSMM